MAARKGPRLYKKQSGTHREKKHVLTLTLWLCAAYNGSPALVHRHRGHKVFFHVGIQDRQLVAIPGIHYFDAHRLQPELLDTLDRQIDPGSMKLASPEGAGDTVHDPLG